MAETLIKDKVCGDCGSEVREHTLFCYHCGGALQAEDFSTDGNDESPSDVWFRSDITEITESSEDVRVDEKTEEKETSKEETEKELEIEVPEPKKEIAETIESEDKEETAEESSVNIKPKPYAEKSKKKKRRRKFKKSEPELIAPISKRTNEEIEGGAKLKSAAALRKREKPARLKKVEIVWEERDNSPNIWFIVFALLLSLLVAVLVFLAFYLK